jgi:hypothetical protein
MNFVERIKPNTTIKVRNSHIPTVHISETALKKMFIYTDEVSDEVGWLGTAYRDGNTYLIKEVFLFDQQVHGATTEITPEGLADFATELMQQPDGMEIWNNMKMWGHSHVNMGITPSGQDDKQMEEFSQNGHDFFIRLICNKKGDLGVDVYDYENGMEFHNAPWVIYHDVVQDEGKLLVEQQLQELYKRIDELELMISEQEKKELEELRTPIQAEIKVKVRRFVSSTYYGGSNGSLHKTPSTVHYTRPSSKRTKVTEDQIDGVKNTIYSFFSYSNLVQLANTCWSYTQFLEDMELDGYYDELSINDLNRVWEEVMKLQSSAQTWGQGGWS